MNHANLETAQVSSTLDINQRVQDLWSQGHPVVHLGFGESRMPMHPKMIRALQQNLHQKSYLDSQGLIDLRKAVAGFQSRVTGNAVLPHQVIVGPGSKALIFAVLLAIDCHVLLPTPSWVSYAPQAKLLNRRWTYLPGTFDAGYEITIDALDGARRESSEDSTRLLILNSPNNPTGKTLSEDKLRELAAYCREQQIYVLSDEIYASITFSGQQHLSMATFYPEGTVVLGGLSKHLSLGGWRLGTAIVPDATFGWSLMQKLRTIASEIWSSPTASVQYAAVQAYVEDSDIQSFVTACTDLHASKTRFLCRSFRQLGIRCTEPNGAFYFIANFDQFRKPLERLGISTSHDLSEFLLGRFLVATLPGSAFGIPEQELSLRIASSYVDMETDRSAQQLMGMFLHLGRMLDAQHLPNSCLAIERLREFIRCLKDGTPVAPPEFLATSR